MNLVTSYSDVELLDDRSVQEKDRLVKISIVCNSPSNGIPWLSLVCGSSKLASICHLDFIYCTD
jgi:hypothetical protein